MYDQLFLIPFYRYNLYFSSMCIDNYIRKDKDDPEIDIVNTNKRAKNQGIINANRVENLGINTPNTDEDKRSGQTWYNYCRYRQSEIQI